MNFRLGVFFNPSQIYFRDWGEFAADLIESALALTWALTIEKLRFFNCFILAVTQSIEKGILSCREGCFKGQSIMDFQEVLQSQ